MRTQGLFEIIVVVLRAASLTLQSLVIGGVVFQRWIANEASTVEGSRRRGLSLVRFSAIALAITQLFYVGINMMVLRQTLSLPWTDVVTANFSYIGLVATAASLAMAAVSRSRSRCRNFPIVLATVILACGVFASHAASRMHDRWLLIPATAVHHLAVALWIGGLPQLWIRLRGSGSAEYSRVLERFPQLALISVLALFGSGLAMALRYVDSAKALYGTSYGIMLVTKVIFFAFLLAIGAYNRMLLRSPEAAHAAFLLRRLLEAEIGIGITAILAAASLTSQPPAADLKIGRVTAQEIYERLRPSWPRLESPAISEVSASTLLVTKEAQQAGLPPPPPHANTREDIAWSEYNHHWAGIFVLLAGLAGLIQARGSSTMRYWPLMLVGLAVFIMLRADPEGWPLGPDSFWESIQDGEVLQHKAFAALLLLLAVFELRVQLGKARTYAAYVFPVVCALAGAFLLTHSHSLVNVKEQVLAEMSHAPIAVAAVLAGWSRWLQIRLPPSRGGLMSRIWPACFVVIGMVLLNYREA
jgi:putative copper resistance protein D